MASELQDQLKAAIQLAQQGQRDAARGLLLRVIESDPKQEAAWMWLAVVSTNRDERLQYLERTLALNPSNERALSAYTKLTGRLYQPGSSSPAQASASVPARPAPGAPVDWTKPLSTRRSPWVTAVILLVTLGVLLAGIYYFVNLAMGDDDDDTPRQAATLNPNVPGAGGTLGGSPTSMFTPTPSNTPLPTVTPGPSPTNPWSNPEATWTPVPSATLPPSRTPLPSYTPLPSATATPPITPVTSTPRPTRTATSAEPVTSTPAAP